MNKIIEKVIVEVSADGLFSAYMPCKRSMLATMLMNKRIPNS